MKLIRQVHSSAELFQHFISHSITSFSFNFHWWYASSSSLAYVILPGNLLDRVGVLCLQLSLFLLLLLLEEREDRVSLHSAISASLSVCLCTDILHTKTRLSQAQTRINLFQSQPKKDQERIRLIDTSVRQGTQRECETATLQLADWRMQHGWEWCNCWRVWRFNHPHLLTCANYVAFCRIIFRNHSSHLPPSLLISFLWFCRLFAALLPCLPYFFCSRNRTDFVRNQADTSKNMKHTAEECRRNGGEEKIQIEGTSERGERMSRLGRENKMQKVKIKRAERQN